MLTTGFDITNMEMRADVLGLKWGPSYYFNQYNQIQYTIPAGVSVIPLSESDDITGTFIVHDTSESERWQSDMMVDNKDYVVGMCSHTTDTYQSMTSQYQQTSQVGYVLYYYSFYAVIVPYNEQVLDIECYSNIMALPEIYDQDAYFQFIQSYGTHFITQSKWGLKYKFLSSFKECMIYTHSESYVYNQVETDGFLHSSEHTTSSGTSYTDEYYTSRRYTIESFDGGNISYHNSLLWDQWVASGANMVNPQPVAMSLRPIYTIINDTVRQQNMIQAYNEYLQMKKQQQDVIIKQKEMGPRSVSLAAFNAGPDPIPYYTVLPTMVKLAADSTSGIFGLDGSCNHMIHDMIGYTPTGQRMRDYCISQFTCQRDQDGIIKAVRYFDSNLWLNTMLSSKDDCVHSQITKYDPGNNLMEKYYWDCYKGSCYGSQVNYQYNSVDNRVQYVMAYYDNDLTMEKNHSVRAYDGNYGPGNMLSVTSFAPYNEACGGYAFCYLDCDGGIEVYFDAGGNPQVICGC